jgi:hypothetical protein
VWTWTETEPREGRDQYAEKDVISMVIESANFGLVRITKMIPTNPHVAMADSKAKMI